MKMNTRTASLYLFFSTLLWPLKAWHVAPAARLSRKNHQLCAAKFGQELSGDGRPQTQLYDLLILGAGPVGVTAALSAAEQGKSVLLVDQPTFSGALMNQDEDLSLGGPTGLFSKALRDTSKRISVATLRGMGISEGSIWNEVRVVCEQLAAINARDRQRALDAAGIECLEGFARLAAVAGPGADLQSGADGRIFEVDVAEGRDMVARSSGFGGDAENGEAEESPRRPARKLRGRKVLLATGSRAFRPPGIPFSQFPERIFDSDSINGLSYLPKSVAITGSGIIAIEFAKIFNRLGADVTLIIRDRAPRRALEKIGLDPDIAAALVVDLVRCGIKIERGVQVESFACMGDIGGGIEGNRHPQYQRDSSARPPLMITLQRYDKHEREPQQQQPSEEAEEEEEEEEGKVIKVDAYLAAVGRVPNTEQLGIESMELRDEASTKGEGGGILTNRLLGRLLDEYGNLAVGPHLETALGGLYAAGDCVGRPFLASTGVAQAAAAVADMFPQEGLPMHLVAGSAQQDWSLGTEDDTSGRGGGPSVLPALRRTEPHGLGLGATGADFDAKRLATDPFAFPVGLWTSPEAAYFGLSKNQARELGVGDASEALALYRECLRGCVFAPDGFLKLVFEQSSGRILGVHIVGDDACELIHYGMELVRAGRTVQDVTTGMYSAVTFHELYQIAARAALDPAAARERRRAAGAAWAKMSKLTAASSQRERRQRKGQ